MRNIDLFVCYIGLWDSQYTIYFGILQLTCISNNMEIHLKLTNLQPKFHLIVIWKTYKIYKDFAKIENRLPLFIYNKVLNLYSIKKMRNIITHNTAPQDIIIKRSPLIFEKKMVKTNKYCENKINNMKINNSQQVNFRHN